MWKRIQLRCNASLEFKGLNLSTASLMSHELMKVSKVIHMPSVVIQKVSNCVVTCW